MTASPAIDRVGWWKGASSVLAVALWWLAMAAWRPNTTFHLAPALVVAAWAVTIRWSVGVPLRRGHAAWCVTGGVAGALAATTALALTGRLTGPDVLGGSAAFAETLIVAFVAAPLTYWATTRGRAIQVNPSREKQTP